MMRFTVEMAPLDDGGWAAVIEALGVMVHGETREQVTAYVIEPALSAIDAHVAHGEMTRPSSVEFRYVVVRGVMS